MTGVPKGPLLALDASTARGSVAIVREGAVIAERSVAMRSPHEEPLLPAVVAALSACGLAAGDLVAVVAGGGPGSFTGLRIAAATAKGLALARDLPLFVVPSLPLVVAAAQPRLRFSAGDRGFLVLIDAMRGECFASRVLVDGAGLVQEWEPSRLQPREAAIARAAEQALTPVGPAERQESWPHARGLCGFSPGAPSPLVRVELAAWEPDYGRLAEAQVRWEAAHGRPLAAG